MDDDSSIYTHTQAYSLAMDRKLYDCVPVHGKQGANGPTKAYACFNCMEFFAELSVAFHWTADATTEFNKWYPHNCAQLIKHDPDTYAALCTMWRCEERLAALDVSPAVSSVSAPSTSTSSTSVPENSSSIDASPSAAEQQHSEAIHVPVVAKAQDRIQPNPSVSSEDKRDPRATSIVGAVVQTDNL